MATDHERYLGACDLIGQSRAKAEEALAILQHLLPNISSPQNRGLINSQIWLCEQVLGRRGSYASQYGQDRWLDTNVFHGRRDGMFVEIGGFDGITGSNCLFFEQQRGWSGLLVEASPSLYARASAVRRCACIQAAISGADGGSAAFLEITGGMTQMGGLVQTYEPEELAVVAADTHNLRATIEVPVRTIASLLTERNLTRVDYVSLDIEGGEMAALAAFPFADFDIAAWTIENKARSPDLVSLMQANGYRLAEVLGFDDVYLKTA